MKKQTLFISKVSVTLVLFTVAVLLYSCGKNTSAPGPSGSPAASAKAGGYARTFTVDSVTYASNVLTMHFVSPGKPDSCYIKIVLTATQYGNYTLADANSPNYATMTIKDKKDTVYITDQWHRGFLQLNQFNSASGNHIAGGNFSFICTENTPSINGRVDTAVGSFSNVTW
jgi:hypothetical protein